MIETARKNRYADAIHKKWGSVVSGGMAGFQAVPDMLLREQGKLGITNSELAVLLNISMYWWEADKWPYPSNAQIAQNTGMAVRSVQRAVSGLEKKGLIERVHTDDSVAYRTRMYFNLSGLIEKLRPSAELYGVIKNRRPEEATLQ